MIRLIEAHGGVLKNLYLDAAEVAPFKAQAQAYPSWDLTPRQLCDLELLLNGGFSPLDGFLNRADYDRVVEEMRLGDGTLWPIPIALDVSEAFAGRIGHGSRVALRDPEGVLIAVLEVGDVWRPDKLREAQQVFGADRRRPSRRFPSAAPDRSRLRRRPAIRHRAAHPLRFPAVARLAARVARPLRQAGLAAGGGLSDSQPDAPRPSGTDPARRPAGRGQSVDSSGGGRNPARRCGPLCAGALLRTPVEDLSRADHRPEPAQPGHADGGAARGALARHHSPESRLQPFHRRPRSRWAGSGPPGPGVLRSRRRPAVGAPPSGRTGHPDRAVSRNGLRAGARRNTSWPARSRPAKPC